VNTTTEPAARTTIAVTGAGPLADRWIGALRGIEGVVAERVGGAGQPSLTRGAGGQSTPDLLFDAMTREDVAAVAFAGPTRDLAASIKRAILANRHVLVAGPAAISAKQLLALDAQARRRSRVLMFDTGTIGDERLDFVRRMVAGSRPLWRARYVRSLRTGAFDGGPIDELAIADISFVLSLLGRTPTHASAVSPRFDDETGAADIALTTLMFDNGMVARIDVSLVEPEPRREVAIACDGRTILLDAYSARTPLQIHAGSRHRGPGIEGWEETVSEHPATEIVERTTRAAASFVAAVRARDIASSNARALALATSAWEAARESMASGGVPVEIGDRAPEARRPALKLIVGGGQVEASHPAPNLKLVAQRHVSPPEDEGPEPLKTA
jgi:predicted dehydrogenase